MIRGLDLCDTNLLAFGRQRRNGHLIPVDDPILEQCVSGSVGDGELALANAVLDVITEM